MTGLLNINTATLEELTALPGVGPVMAARIVAARPFEMIDDLRLVSGVGPALLERWTPLITLVDPAPPEEVILLSAEPESEPEAAEASSEGSPLSESESAPPSPEEEIIPPWDGPESKRETSEPEIVLSKEKSIIPVEPLEQEEEQEATTRPKTITWGQAIALTGVSSFLAFILAVLLSLGILSSINGGLRFGTADRVSALATQAETLNLQIQTLNQEISSLRSRLDNLEGISSRVKDLESQVKELDQEMASIADAFVEIDAQIEELLESTSTFQFFLDGLMDLVDNLREK